MRTNYRSWLIPIVILIVAVVWVVLPTNPGINIGSFHRSIRVVRGLDLQGGLRVLLEADVPASQDVTSEQLTTARSIIENRVNGLGVSEPLIQIAGNRRILVELPGIGDPEQAVAAIKETGLLEFVDPGTTNQSEVIALEGQVITTDFGEPAGSEPPSPPETSLTPETAQATVDGTAEATQGAATPTAGAGDGSSPPIFYHTVMTGAVLKSAGVNTDQTGVPYVAFELTNEGSTLFGDYTSSHVGQYLMIVLDKKVISTPRIQEAITTGTGSITGNFTVADANALAVQLRYGALPVPLKVVESQSVGPTLGQDSLRKSTIAGIVGLTVVILFMALYYRLPGLVADMALIVYALTTFALFKMIPVTLTLPGIAGFVLSIGVAVDANILIFERMKEELRGGRTLAQAIDLGFSRAWPSIRDSNLSTLITCLILYWFGSTFGASIVKGFALTLATGVLVSLFTAITVTRTFLHVILDGLGVGKHARWFGV
ncbi:MAG TPA: protein translocase subunit SecD [Anaerolineales bacterium]|nr:protein translocase subunit SecD [Anaerolineales bacterium]